MIRMLESSITGLVVVVRQSLSYLKTSPPHPYVVRLIHVLPLSAGLVRSEWENLAVLLQTAPKQRDVMWR